MRASNQLIEAACSGNEAAIEQLLTVCQPDLKRFARRTCTNTEDAEDAVQVALWRLHRKIGMLRTVAAFATWLFRIVERECYRLFSARKATVSIDDLADDQHPQHWIPLDLRTDLTRAIQTLPEGYRAVLVLRDVDGLTTPEVASELGISGEAVKSRLHRARAIVRDKLIASGYWDGNSNTEQREV
jgi:RNA polymerase sigma factor (sigma-70 family)